jgi:D-glycero-D-manno-heptose 1,7-bisphosphate phosphatase
MNHVAWLAAKLLDHLGVASADHEAALDVFSRRLGCPLESTQTDMEVHIAVESFTSDKYGVVYHTRAPEPVGGLRVAFITVGDCELEFLQDVYARQGGHVAHGLPDSTRQDQGAIGRFIAARGPGLHHVALKVTDINGALARLKRAGFAVFVVSNQSGIGRGLITDEQYHAVQAEFLRQVGPGLIDASYYCPDAPGVPSTCRKPEPGMVLRAAAEHGVDLAASFFVGDKTADVECGRRAGTRTILVRTGYGATQECAADRVCADAVEAVDAVLGLD